MRYYEFVVEAPLMLVKGFVLGWLKGRGKENEVYFSKKLGIERSTLMEAVREWLGIENLTHFVIPEYLKDELKQAIEEMSVRLGMTIKSLRLIKGARIEFDFHIFNQEIAQQLKELLKAIPKDYLKELKEREVYEEDADQAELYAPLHPYEYHGHAVIEGSFKPLIDYYVKLKEMPQVYEKPLKLIFEK